MHYWAHTQTLPKGKAAMLTCKIIINIMPCYVACKQSLTSFGLTEINLTKDLSFSTPHQAVGLAAKSVASTVSFIQFRFYDPVYIEVKLTSAILSQRDFSHRKFRLLSQGKAGCDRVALPNLLCILGALMFL